MPDLVVVACNLHNARNAVANLERMRWHAALYSEGHKRQTELGNVKRSRNLTGPTPGPSREVGVLLRRRVKVRGFESTFLTSRAARYPRVGKERWGHVAVIGCGPVEVALIVVHPVAGSRITQGTIGRRHPLARRYMRAQRWVRRTIAEHKAAGREVVFGGDIQVKPSNAAPWSIYRALEAHGLSWHAVGIDVIAWTPGLTAVKRTHHDIGSDHPAIRVAFNLTNRRQQ